MVPNHNGFFDGLPVEVQKAGKKSKPLRFVKKEPRNPAAAAGGAQNRVNVSQAFLAGNGFNVAAPSSRNEESGAANEAMADEEEESKEPGQPNVIGNAPRPGGFRKAPMRTRAKKGPTDGTLMHTAAMMTEQVVNQVEESLRDDRGE